MFSPSGHNWNNSVSLASTRISSCFGLSCRSYVWPVDSTVKLSTLVARQLHKRKACLQLLHGWECIQSCVFCATSVFSVVFFSNWRNRKTKSFSFDISDERMNSCAAPHIVLCVFCLFLFVCFFGWEGLCVCVYVFCWSIIIWLSKPQVSDSPICGRFVSFRPLESNTLDLSDRGSIACERCLTGNAPSPQLWFSCGCKQTQVLSCPCPCKVENLDVLGDKSLHKRLHSHQCLDFGC